MCVQYPVLSRLEVEFLAPVIPGEVLTTNVWIDGRPEDESNRVLFSVNTVKDVVKGVRSFAGLHFPAGVATFSQPVAVPLSGVAKL